MRATNTHKFSQVNPNYKPTTASLHPLIVWYRHDHVSGLRKNWEDKHEGVMSISSISPDSPRDRCMVDDGRDGIPALHAW
jgi:hypothetical protein